MKGREIRRGTHPDNSRESPSWCALLSYRVNLPASSQVGIICLTTPIYRRLQMKPLLISSLQHHPILLLSKWLHLVQVLKGCGH